jgi:hypothetical protein
MDFRRENASLGIDYSADGTYAYVLRTCSITGCHITVRVFLIGATRNTLYIPVSSMIRASRQIIGYLPVSFTDRTDGSAKIKYSNQHDRNYDLCYRKI